MLLYSNKIESVGLRNVYSASARKRYQTNTSYNVYISLPYIMAARTAGMDRNDEITLLLPYVYR